MNYCEDCGKVQKGKRFGSLFDSIVAEIETTKKKVSDLTKKTDFEVDNEDVNRLLNKTRSILSNAQQKVQWARSSYTKAESE